MRRHIHQVQLSLPGHIESIFKRHYAKPIAISIDHEHFPGFNLLINEQIFGNLFHLPPWHSPNIDLDK